jgi:hypothetical protein
MPANVRKQNSVRTMLENQNPNHPVNYPQRSYSNLQRDSIPVAMQSSNQGVAELIANRDDSTFKTN